MNRELQDKMKRSILFISGSLGLGQIARDLAIADELRRLNEKVETPGWLLIRPATCLPSAAAMVQKLLRRV
jgi:predicted glycosyltransferase